MNKKSIPVSNNYCPQTLFLYGTYKEDGTPNFGLFCWLSYYWEDGLSIMACIGEEKMTKDRIRATGVFSANLVTESMLHTADYLGNTAGYNPEKMNFAFKTVRGEVLDVPIWEESPWSFELEVKKNIKLEGSDIFLCRIRNVLVDENLADSNLSIEERVKLTAPVVTTCHTYFSIGKRLGEWGEWKDKKK